MKFDKYIQEYYYLFKIYYSIMIENIDNTLVCPICGQHVKNLISHIRRSHDNSIKNRRDFENKFPDLKGIKLQISKFDKSKEFVCEVCGKVYRRKNDIQNHYRTQHPELYKKTEIIYSLPSQECPICGKMLGNLRQHIRESHNLQWEDFCEKYNWDIKKSKIVTDEYRKKLSDNKKSFYQSEQGQERKKIQSKNWKENNPVYDPEKLSKSIYSRTKHGNLRVLTEDMGGIKVQYNGNTFRSFNEFEFYILCNKYNLNVTYEPNEYCVKWYNEEKGFFTTYLPDFYIENIGLIELKHSKYEVVRCQTKQKYIKVNKIYHKKNINYKITYIAEFFKNIGIELDFEDSQYIKEVVINSNNQDKIKIISPYRHSQKLIKIFNESDLSKINCITFTKKNRT